MLTFWIAVGIFVVVGGILLYTVVRFRQPSEDVAAERGVSRSEVAAAGEDAPADGDTASDHHGNTKLEIAWTLIPILILVIIAVPTVRQSFLIAAPPTDDVLDVRVVGYQWWWSFEYPDEGIVTANELRIPTGKAVRLTMESEDVIHSFWVPKLAGKTDVLPGRENEMWIEADEPGVYFGQCAEFCGLQHANMKFRVVAKPPEEYEAWANNWGGQALPESPAVGEAEPEPAATVDADETNDVNGVDDATDGDVAAEPADEQPTPEESEEMALLRRGKELFAEKGCAACHAIDGTDAKGTAGPNLTDFGSRTTLAAGMLDNTPENLTRWLRDPQAVKPGSYMPNLNLQDNEIEALVEYLHSLE